MVATSLINEYAGFMSIKGKLDKLYTASKVCADLAISRQTLNKWMRKGKIKFYKPTPQFLRFAEADILDFLNKRTLPESENLQQSSIKSTSA